ncbi:hypothetical protein HMPREF9296_2235 [Prevotella disiens FB035-09AN]|uniref:DUF4435 domain-containing protein n=1 Tax=Prevotella disiens FB035-09AN TaxID=866771 RepID=E1KR40_9BACT|nr:DUF4435 domain-containing protein [Prevotella disiens]EFL46071.1 hypothetical protein HMPREF9296_2235 [Prevotella disiens FB035-09AN]
MGKQLRENLSSEYIQAANRLNGRNARKKILAYVESYDDIFFWRTALSEFENEERYFEVMLPSRQTLTRGKKSVLMNLLQENVGESMIACVDADYDYLLQGLTSTSQAVNYNPYVFHTYAYAIENLQCFAGSLHDVTVAVTLNDKNIFDFEEYLCQYSEAIFPLFVWNIWFYRNNIYGRFTITDFNHIIELGNFSFSTAFQNIQRVRKKVARKIQQFHKDYPDAKESYLAVKEDIKHLGVTPQTTYLYIQGHHLFDNVVVPALKRVCDRLIRDMETEIQRNAVHIVQQRNELSSYSHSVENIIPMLRRNVAYNKCEPYKRLKADLEDFFNRNKESKTPPLQA